MNLSAKTAAGNTHQLLLEYNTFLTEVLNLEIAHFEKEKEFVQLGCVPESSGSLLGESRHPFTHTSDGEFIIADVRHRKMSAV